MSDKNLPKLPFYQLYVDDFDRGVEDMSLAEVGLYALALNRAWKRGSIPDNPNKLALLIGKRPAEVKRLWANVKTKWVEAAPGELVNVRQEVERAKAISKSVKASLAANIRHASALRWQVPSSADALPRASESESISSGGGPGGIDARSVTQELWDLHPSPSESGFVEAAVANEMRNSVHSVEVFSKKIVDSLRLWVEYWTTQKRYATGLKKWVESGDYAKTPPFKTASGPQTHYETPEEREARITREDAARRSL